jgi:hypothetical protein
MSYSITVEEVEPKVFMVFMRNTTILGRTFMRFQEHYESPYQDIRNKIFTRDYFKRIYKKRREAKKFTYCSDWAGYNIPSYILKPFMDGKFNPLIECEKKLVNFFKNIKGKFYVIGSTPKDHGTIRHEISHGLWYTNKKYKEAQRFAIKSLSQKSRKKIDNYLKSYGYCDEVLEDETVAFLVTNSTWIKEDCRIPAKEFTPAVERVIETFDAFSGRFSRK